MDDLLRLWRREVRLSSSGFMSGGNFDILRKVMARYIDMASETRWKPPSRTLRRNVANMTLYVAVSSSNRVCHSPVVSMGCVYWLREIKAINTKNGIKLISRIAAKR